MKKKALLVNDSKFENLILQDMLSKLDYDVEIASEFDALYEIEQFDPHLIIVNYIMQDTSGDQLIGLIKEDNPKTTCLLSSSSSIRKEDFDVAIDGILRTPVSMFTLQDLLNRIGEKPLRNIEILSTRDQENSKNEDDRFCPGCDRNITMFGDMIVFCPFCGESMS